MKKPAAAGQGGAPGLRDQAEKDGDLSAGQPSESCNVASSLLASKGRKKKLSAGKHSEIGNVASQLLTSKGRKKKMSAGQPSEIGDVASPPQKKKTKASKSKKATCAPKKSCGNMWEQRHR